MYPYHNKIKQRIKNGELIGFEFAEDWPKIGSCLLLRFSTLPAVRPHGVILSPARLTKFNVFNYLEALDAGKIAE